MCRSHSPVPERTDERGGLRGPQRNAVPARRRVLCPRGTRAVRGQQKLLHLLPPTDRALGQSTENPQLDNEGN